MVCSEASIQLRDIASLAVFKQDVAPPFSFNIFLCCDQVLLHHGPNRHPTPFRHSRPFSVYVMYLISTQILS